MSATKSKNRNVGKTERFNSVLVTDSREQQPLEFKPGLFDKYEVDGLPFGDYWLRYTRGSEEVTVPIAFERKGFGDLFSTMTGRYKRFKNEMVRAKENNFKLILLIEGTMEQVFAGYKHSKFDGDSMLRKLAMLYVRYGLEYHFCANRREMARRIEDTFLAIGRNYKAVGAKEDRERMAA